MKLNNNKTSRASKLELSCDGTSIYLGGNLERLSAITVLLDDETQQPGTIANLTLRGVMYCEDEVKTALGHVTIRAHRR